MKPFERISLNDAGVCAQAVLDALDAWERKGVEMHSFMLLRHGKVCAEGWWQPYAPSYEHIIYSYSKSFTSIAIGFAEQEGLLSLQEKLVDIFSDVCPKNPSENLRKATIEHLLTMSCGHEAVVPDRYYETGEWIEKFLAHPVVFEPGTHFFYNTTGSNLLCAILQKRAGLNLTEYLRPRLFTPLGMSDDIACFTLPDGVEGGGFGYSLRTEDMAKFIQFIANKGVWDGKQLLNSSWIERAVSKQIETASADGATGATGAASDWDVGYGYQFWRCKPAGLFRADGAYGQYGIVFPQKDAVLVITSTGLDTNDTLDTVWETILPGLQDGAVTEDKTAAHKLAYRLKHLSLSRLPGFHNAEAEAACAGKTYQPEAHSPAFTTLIGGAGCVFTRRPFAPTDRLQSIAFSFREGDGIISCRQNDQSYDLRLGMQGQYALTEINGVPFAANAFWRAPEKLEAIIRNLHTASGRRVIFAFADQSITMTIDPTPPLDSALADVNFREVKFAARC
jgi:CubicO group peptidase (beta-lactamase class C family)